jgi:hypothetical protein
VSRSGARRAAGQLDRGVETARARIKVQPRQRRLGGGVRLDVERAHLVVEGDPQVLGVGDAVLAGERAQNPRFDLLRRDGPARAGHRDLFDAAGVESDDLVRAHRLGDPARRHAAGLAEIGGAKDRDLGDRARVLDEIADAHEFAGDDDLALERGACGRLLRLRR